MTNQSRASKLTLKAILAIVVVLSLVVSAFVPIIAIASSTNKVNIIDGTRTVAITTTETEPIKILKSAGITLESSDKLDITSFDENGGDIVISRLTNINIDFDGQITTHSVYASTVGEALETTGYAVGKDDGLNYNIDDPICEGMVISIKKAFYVTLSADGQNTKYAVISGIVKDLIERAGIKLNADDFTTPSLDTKLTNGMNVVVNRVEFKSETKEEATKYSTKKIKDASMAQGKTKTITKGVKGTDKVTYQVKYINGEKAEQTELTRVTVKQPVQAVVKIGSKKVASSVKPNGRKSHNGISIGDKISGRYTHYCACATCNGNSRGITTSGRRIRNGMDNPYYIACNWLPLGSVIRVKGHNYTVVDRGGSGLSRKGRIDIFTPGGHKQCYRLGTGNCSIEIVRLGW